MAPSSSDVVRHNNFNGSAVTSQSSNHQHQGDFLNFPSLKADKKVIDSVNKRIDKLVHLCQNPRLHLRSSPPYLLDILPDIYQKLKTISSAYRNNLEELFNTPYFQVFLNNLIKKCKSTCTLFKDAKELMFDERSDYRRKLTKNSLLFSHIHKDLDALYPNNRFSPETFRITKSEAEAWWKDNFDSSPIISWSTFQTALFKTFKVRDRSQLHSLQSTIDLTCNDYVSIFEFDVFVRLFQPWNNVIETWRALVVLHSGYMAFMTYDEVKAVLKRFRHHPGPGSYVYRLSCTKLGQWAIGYITDDLRILQTIIQNKSLAQALIDGEREGFYVFPNGTPSQSSILLSLVENIPQAHFQVSQEQHELYCRIGSTFELCKICAENNKNVRLEPCGHLLCKSCLVHCQHSATGQTCPFCRLDIKSIEDIVLDPYSPSEAPFPTVRLKQLDLESAVTNAELELVKSGSLSCLEENKLSLIASQKSSSFSRLSISSDPFDKTESLDFDAFDDLVFRPGSKDIHSKNVSNGSIGANALHCIASTSFSNCVDSCLSKNPFSAKSNRLKASEISNKLPSVNTFPKMSAHSCAISKNMDLEQNTTSPHLQPFPVVSSPKISTADYNIPLHLSGKLNGSSISLRDAKGDDVDSIFRFDGKGDDNPVSTDIAGDVNIDDMDSRVFLDDGAPMKTAYDVSNLLRRDDISVNGIDLTEEIALQLLQITDGNCDMAVRIWRNFVPRNSLSDHDLTT